MVEKRTPKNQVQKTISTTQGWVLNALEKLKSGELTIPETLEKLSLLPYEEIGYAKIDHHRSLRKGFPEVIFGRGKTAEQIAFIAKHLISHSDRLLVTHAGQDAFDFMKASISDAVYNPISRTIVVNRIKKFPHRKPPERRQLL